MTTTDGASVAARLGAIAIEVEVTAVSSPTPSVRRIRLSAPGLEEMKPAPGQDVMLAVTGKARRRYSVRSYDPSVPCVDLDFVMHGDGPAAQWAAGAGPGTRIEIIGPRGKVLLDEGAQWHLFAGDDTFVPAAFSMAGAVPAGMPVLVVLEVDNEADHQSLETAAALAGPEWLHREGGPEGTPEQLVAALTELALPAGRGHAYLAGEFRVVNAMRAVLMERGMAAEDISPKPYWRKGRANQDHGEPERD